jgi:transcriptional regulator with XRE-family HTH domain
VARASTPRALRVTLDAVSTTRTAQHQQIGIRLHAARWASGLTLREVEQLTQGRTKASMLSHLEHGTRSLSVCRAIDLAAVYGIPLGDLLTGAA